MTYLNFHLYFTIPLLLGAFLINLKNPMFYRGKSWLALFTLLVLALTYTTPWDSYLISSGVWAYPENRIIFSLLKIPVEEYFFFVVQTFIGCLLSMYILKNRPRITGPYSPSRWDKVFVVLFSTALILTVFYSLEFVFHENAYRYLFLVAGWASPVILIQWALGYRILLKHKWHLLAVVLPLTAYLWIVDSVAIAEGIWYFPAGQSTGLTLGAVLPVEEALFFFTTNLMVVQGYILFTQFSKAELPVKLGGRPFCR